MVCCKQCFKQNDLYSKEEHENAKQQLRNFEVITAERITHKGKGTYITSRAIIYAPVGNVNVFKEKEPSVAFIGFSTSIKAMKAFYRTYYDTRDFERASRECSFSGSTSLRRNLKRIAKYLEINRLLSHSFLIDEMFDSNQKELLYTQIIKCCSIGNCDGIYNTYSAIYPRLVEKK